ncbi:hypothetical protein [Tolypothrix sp. VBCCA 56010]
MGKAHCPLNNCPLPIKQLPIAHYPLPIPNAKEQNISNQRLLTSCG